MEKSKRAVSLQQKQEKRAQILKAAHTLFVEGSYDQVNVASIAKASKVAKGTVYLYFQSKEEIFYTIYDQLNSVYIQTLKRLLDDLPDMADPLLLTDTLLKAFESAPDLPRFNGLLGVYLENVPLQLIEESRQATMAELKDHMPVLLAKFGFEDATIFASFMVQILTVTRGAYHLSVVPLDVRQLGASGDVDIFAQSFETIYRTMIPALIRNLRSSS